MKGRKLIILIIIMALTLIGLIVTQYVLIYNIVSLSKDRFDQAANQAIRRTVFFIEEKETILYLASTIAEQHPELNNTIDSLGDNIKFISEAERRIKGYGDKNVDHLLQIIQKELNGNYPATNAAIEQTIIRMLRDAQQIDLRNRLDFDEINEVLANHFETNNIDEPFEFFIYDQNNSLIYYSPLIQSNKRVRKPTFVYKMPLFPYDLHTGDAHIKVVFPTMRNEMLTNYRGIWPLIILSFVILLIFIYTALIINRQRTINEVTNDFVNNMTHELKTPMASISLASQMLSDTHVAKTPERINSLTKIISDECSRLQLLIDKVLQFGTYEENSLRLKLNDLHINPIISNACKTFEVNVSHVNGQITEMLEAQYDVVLIDQIHFTNIIYNLLDNAVKYRSPDRLLIINVRTRSNQENTIQIIIEDNGIGIARDNQRKIFDKFFRVHTGNRHDVRGYGIGLAYVKQVVLAHQGTINVESELGIGTKFIITLPTL